MKTKDYKGTDLNYKIKELNDIIQRLEVVEFAISGSSGKKYQSGSGTVKEQIPDYLWFNIGSDLDNLLSALIEEHGEEECPGYE